MRDGDDQELGPLLERALPIVEAPPGFAERVVAARGLRRSRRGVLVAGTLAAAAALLAIALLGRTNRGSLHANQRETVPIGGRAVVVAEAGTELSWTSTLMGAVRVEQPKGDVFYRVDRGREFVVAAAGGEVVVEGTCFRVEVRDMGVSRQHLVGAGVGALATSALIVTVYEGVVTVANPGGTVTVAAGQRADSRSGAPPLVTSASATNPDAEGKPVPSAFGASEQSATDVSLRERLAAARLAELEQKLAATERRAAELDQRSKATPDGGEASDSHHGPDVQGEPMNWERVADGSMQWQVRLPCPGPRFDAAKLARIGVPVEDSRSLEAAYETARQRSWKEIEPLCRELTGGQETGAALLPNCLKSIAFGVGGSPRRKAMFELVADVHHGRKVAPEGADALTRILVAISFADERFEGDLLERYGAQTAHLLAYATHTCLSGF